MNQLSSLMFLAGLQSREQIARQIPQSQQQAPQIDPISAALISLLASAAGGGQKKPKTPEQRERARFRAMTIRQYAVDRYLPGRNHLPTSATAELTRNCLDRIEEFAGPNVALKQITPGWIEDLVTWFARQVRNPSAKYGSATANKHLRTLRAILGHAAEKRIIKRLPFSFLPEQEPRVVAWTIEDYAAIEQRARSLTGHVGCVPADAFWTAWVLVFQKLGSRVTATMLATRDDYDAEARTLTLRAENQKQKKSQRIALPASAAAAIERLLSLHSSELIFGSWPHDPPTKSGQRKWNTLADHFERTIVIPAGLKLQKGVKMRQFRRSTATIVEETGGNAQELLGHSSRRVTELYLSRDPKRRKICKQSLMVPDACPQRTLF